MSRKGWDFDIVSYFCDLLRRPSLFQKSLVSNNLIITVEFFSLFKPETEEELGWVTLRFGRYLLFFVTFVTYYWEDPANFKSDPWSI